MDDGQIKAFADTLDTIAAMLESLMETIKSVATLLRETSSEVRKKGSAG